VATIVYLLCALTSLACAVLLLRSWRERRIGLLLWSGLCFGCFALNNALLIVDRVVLPTMVDLSVARSIPVVVGLALLIYGLIWES
jgi:hypothetical protein